jgi:DNA-binding Xre family transcriptional regulator
VSRFIFIVLFCYKEITMAQNETLDIKSLYKKKRRKLPRLKIAEAIEKSGLTYMEIAKRLGLNHYQNITKLKTAENISFRKLCALALALECRVKDLYEE